jgi:hypothetical protein
VDRAAVGSSVAIGRRKKHAEDQYESDECA